MLRWTAFKVPVIILEPIRALDRSRKAACFIARRSSPIWCKSTATLTASLFAPGKIALEILLGPDFLYGCPATDAVFRMTDFVPQPVCTPYHFDIKHGRQDCWIVRDRGGLTGGIFLTRKDAVRFALFEVGGDSARVHVPPERRQARRGHAA
jgi:hypothetical protein